MPDILRGWLLALAGLLGSAPTPETRSRTEPRQEQPRNAREAGLSVSPVALSGSRRQASATRVELPKPLPGVVPRGVPELAADDAVASALAYAANMASAVTVEEGQSFLGYPALAELAQRPEYRAIVETHAREMTRKWIRLRATGDEDKTERIKRLEAALDRYRVQELFRRVAELDGFFGRAHIFIDLGNDDPDELTTLLVCASAKIRRGSLRTLRLVEPVWTYPASFNSTDPLRDGFYRPSSWWVMGKQIHASRLLTFSSREVPDLIKPLYMFSGLSMTQIAKPYVDNWLRTRQSVADTVHSFSVSGVKTNMAATLTGDAMGGGVLERVQLMNQIRDNRGALVLDKETEEWFNVSVPLGTLDHLQAQAQEQMGSVSGTPLVWLLGLTPTGLNATTDGEERVFHSRIEAAQVHLFERNLRVVLDVLQLSEFGDVDPSISFTWEPLWQLDGEAKARIKLTEAQTDSAYLADGVVTADEVRQRLANDEESPYHGLDLSQPAPGAPDLDDESEMGKLLGGAANENAPGEEDDAEEEGAGDDEEAREGRVAHAFDKEAPWHEGDHPRRKDGKFGSGGGSATKATPKGQADKLAAKAEPAKAGKGAASKAGTISTAAGTVGAVSKIESRVYNGRQVETTRKLSKSETGAIGEAVATHVFRQLYPGQHVGPVNDEKSNYATDLLAGDHLVEIKPGLVSNNEKSHRWTASIGEPGKEEKAQLALMSDEEKREHNAGKERAIMERKLKALEEVSAKVGRTLTPQTVTMILNPDSRSVDLYRFSGYHHRINWRSDEAKAGYVGSYRYEESERASPQG